MKSADILLQEVVAEWLNERALYGAHLLPRDEPGAVKCGPYKWAKSSALDRAIIHLRAMGKRLIPASPARFADVEEERGKL
jgi:hypothetical protein